MTEEEYRTAREEYGEGAFEADMGAEAIRKIVAHMDLDKLAGDPVDLYANGRLVARGEILVLNDNFCVRVSEVMTEDPHRVSSM